MDTLNIPQTPLSFSHSTVYDWILTAIVFTQKYRIVRVQPNLLSKH